MRQSRHLVRQAVILVSEGNEIVRLETKVSQIDCINLIWNRTEQTSSMGEESVENVLTAVKSHDLPKVVRRERCKPAYRLSLGNEDFAWVEDDQIDQARSLAHSSLLLPDQGSCPTPRPRARR